MRTAYEGERDYPFLVPIWFFTFSSPLLLRLHPDLKQNPVSSVASITSPVSSVPERAHRLNQSVQKAPTKLLIPTAERATDLKQWGLLPSFRSGEASSVCKIALDWRMD